MSHGGAQHRFLLRLLFDADAREGFAQDRAQALAEAGLEGAAALPFTTLKLAGLVRDADQRRDYLMSALCRAYPRTAGALGAAPGGARALSAFLASPAAIGPTPARNQAFGQHLARLISIGASSRSARTTALLEAFLAWEQGLVQSAARVREAVARGEPVPAPQKPTKNARKRHPLCLPPFFFAVRLPVPSALLSGALEHIDPANAWFTICSGRLSAHRLDSVARGVPTPVTVLCRGIARGHTTEPGGVGALAPVVDVRHLTAELPGDQHTLLAQIDGSTPVGALPTRFHGMLHQLLDAGLLALAA